MNATYQRPESPGSVAFAPGFFAAIGFQVALIRKDTSNLFSLITAPLFAVSLMAVIQHSGRTDLAAYAVVAPAIMAIFSMALFESGEIISRDRQSGVLEAIMATPVSLSWVVLGRVGAITVLSLIAVLECWLVGALMFGEFVSIGHPLLFAVTLMALSLGVASTGVVMAAAFVVGRSVRSFQNSISFPLFLLGGVLVPASFLPGFLHPISNAFFLSWATDLLRDSLTATPVEDALFRLGAIVGLSALMYALGMWLMHRLLVRIRRTGKVNFA
ncbi:ABC transporter permease [Natronoglycomyces albus]|uniref:Transport permease protein n=1 Tax=Natronoglycomyces albus TaxID=2811108 RepID=A0A895XF73_9ACTN|nr:ABC transporter permease [Natronoglycomyces albus]QSB03974.1 ABC transporter permease [Natronoglycomyces albus]